VSFAVCGVLVFAINWIAFVPAYLRRTELTSPPAGKASPSRPSFEDFLRYMRTFV